MLERNRCLSVSTPYRFTPRVMGLQLNTSVLALYSMSKRVDFLRSGFLSESYVALKIVFLPKTGKISKLGKGFAQMHEPQRGTGERLMTREKEGNGPLDERRLK